MRRSAAAEAGGGAEARAGGNAAAEAGAALWNRRGIDEKEGEKGAGSARRRELRGV